jgi:hypothetical protein
LERVLFLEDEESLVTILPMAYKLPSVEPTYMTLLLPRQGEEEKNE